MATTAEFIIDVPKWVQDEVPLRLTLPNRSKNGADWFYEFCQINDFWRFERTAQGEIIVMAPPGGDSGYSESRAITQLMNWTDKKRSGRAYGNTGFRLPNGAVRSPDAAWVRQDRLAKLTRDETRKHIPLCPDFVIEIRSPSDRLPKLQAKMVEYLENGARLGWLIDPDKRRVHVYRPRKPVEILDHPMKVPASPEVPGFVLKLAEIWNPGL